MAKQSNERLTGMNNLFLASAEVPVSDDDGVVRALLEVSNLVAKGDLDAVVLHLASGPGKVVRILLAGGDCATAVDERKKTIFAVEIGQEGVRRAGIAERGEVFHEAG